MTKQRADPISLISFHKENWLTKERQNEIRSSRLTYAIYAMDSQHQAYQCKSKPPQPSAAEGSGDRVT